MKKEIKVNTKGLPKEVKEWLPKTVVPQGAYMLFPISTPIVATGKIFTGFDTFPLYGTHTYLKFLVGKTELTFLCVLETKYHIMSYETLFSREYPSYEYYYNALRFDSQ